MSHHIKKYKNVNVCNKFCYSIIVPYHPPILNIFFLFLNFTSPYYLKNKTKAKTFLLLVCPQLLLHFFHVFLSHFASLSPYYSLLYHYTSFIIFSFLYFDFSSLHLILYKFDIISPIQFIFFSHKKCEYSLSVDFCSFLLL